jgi:sialate O-acetylesterase
MEYWCAAAENRESAVSSFCPGKQSGILSKLRSIMKNLWLFALAAWMVSVAGPSVARALPDGRDVIDVPAVSEGLCVSNLFQSNMVLQRDEPVSIWGWASPGEKVTVTFGDAEQSAVAGDDRAWEVTLPAMSASTDPRPLIVQGAKKTLTLDNVLVGDVWVLGGQSNMEFPIHKIQNGQLEMASANFPQIRLLTVPRQSRPEPAKGFPRLDEWSGWSSRHFRKGDWNVCSPENVREFSAIGYVFARRLKMASEVPIGVIDTSVGGTTLETWTPDSVIREIDTDAVDALLSEWDKKVEQWDAKADLKERQQRYQKRVKKLKEQGKEVPDGLTKPTDLRPGPAMAKNRPGNSYAGMIAPLAGLAVKGAIFHQGFNNCFDGTRGAIRYRQVFPKMITAWRKAFDDPNMPFGILSLCTAGQDQTRDNYSEFMHDAGPYIREAQYETFLQFYEAGDKNIGFVSTYDLRRRWYHPQLKIPAGERIARWALATQYGYGGQIKWKPPMLEKMVVQDGRIVLHMDTNVDALDDGSPVEGFAIAGKDRRFHPAKASPLKVSTDNGKTKKDSSALVLTSPMVPDPVHFRYAWGRNPMGNLQARSHQNLDLPFATQRSDDWRMENIPKGVLGENPPVKLNRGQRRKVKQALHRQDIRRRLKEARAFIEKHGSEVAENQAN